MALRFATPEQAEASFYRAFESLDLALMEQVWSDDPETACVHPGGDLLLGKAAVLQSWKEILTAADRPSIVFRTLQVVATGELAVHLVEEMIRPSSRPGTEATRVIATNTYRRGRDGWRLLGHHASLPMTSRHAGRRGSRLH
jgi:hypothetical protein